MKTQNIKRRSFISGVSKAGLFSCLPIAPSLVTNAASESQERAPNTFLTEPYLQAMDFNGVTIMWVNSGSSVSWIEISGPNMPSRQVYGHTRGLIDASNRIVKIRIDQLKPNTAYEYTVFSKEIKDFQPYKMVYGETIKKGPYTFTTPDESAEEISFVVFNDLHDHPNNITELMGKFCSPPDYDFVVYNGDAFDWNDSEERIIRDLLTPSGKVFSPNYPFLMVQGNHEPRGNFARQMFDYFDYPENSCYYAFTRGPVRFIVLDSGEDKTDQDVEYSGLVSFDSYREEQARWLEQEISTKAFQQAAFRVVFIHIPVFHAGEWHGTLHCRELFNPLFNKGKIDIAISGHTHRYGTYDADPATHNYPIVIGGGPGFIGRGGGTRTIIKTKATKQVLTLEMLVDDGTVVGSYHLKK